MVKVKVYVTLKQGILDPQGQTVEGALKNLGFEEVENVRIGKYITLSLRDGKDISSEIEKMCKKLLANPVIEDYSYEILE